MAVESVNVALISEREPPAAVVCEAPMSPLSSSPIARRARRILIVTLFLLGMSVYGFLIMGYHPGAEDDGIYLAAVKADLNPFLYPHNSEFFKAEMKATVFDSCMAAFVGSTGIQLAWAEMLWQFATIFLFLTACWSIVSQLFDEWAARCAAIAMCAAMFTLPIAGTALYIVDQYFNPRLLATVLILFGVSRILLGYKWQSIALVVPACALHPIMGAFGVVFCFVLGACFSLPSRVRQPDSLIRLARGQAVSGVAFIPFGWLCSPPSAIWLETLRSRHWACLEQWTWYEWLGVIGPLFLFWLVSRIEGGRGRARISCLATAIVIYSCVCQIAALVIAGSYRMAAFRALEPMRYLHLVYVFLVLMGGAYLGQHVLRSSTWRWVLFVIAVTFPMYATQRQLFAATEHIEWPGHHSANSWSQSFDWIRENTPPNAYFALDPEYMSRPGEDAHSFRALAERSTLADSAKDGSVVTKAPELASEWQRQVSARQNWRTFRRADFERLKAEFGVNWVVLETGRENDLICPWHNHALSVCQIP